MGGQQSLWYPYPDDDSSLQPLEGLPWVSGDATEGGGDSDSDLESSDSRTASSDGSESEEEQDDLHPRTILHGDSSHSSDDDEDTSDDGSAEEWSPTSVSGYLRRDSEDLNLADSLRAIMAYHSYDLPSRQSEPSSESLVSLVRLVEQNQQTLREQYDLLRRQYDLLADQYQMLREQVVGPLSSLSETVCTEQALTSRRLDNYGTQGHDLCCLHLFQIGDNTEYPYLMTWTIRVNSQTHIQSVVARQHDAQMVWILRDLSDAARLWEDYLGDHPGQIIYQDEGRRFRLEGLTPDDLYVDLYEASCDV